MTPSAGLGTLPRAQVHVLRARVAIERGRLWQAEHWLSETRHHALALACLGHGFAAWHGRTVDRLPGDLRSRFEETLIGRAESETLLRALRAAVGLVREAAGLAGVLSERLDEQLAELVST